ncbi:murein biosynthesis integral membrane protein MurJ [Hoeflea prorocentri]|uniref:Probable lipid II flippase MurJ n=1 Tax=Hoeflea prorocentri TaxID=1922333 RepID=A0A9X3UK21_9HYPH|nr:murein biosynthesis integral membrane protein MurJ [Hoeflea prorocentri]MCY6382772.1 murein biosynthesis integral membrane protein MurJ [Hoeflea prorocentri]MDA5400572.1 murein biosynthesis integral membrane protein MurJ [Hoeflea prorocentri]
MSLLRKFASVGSATMASRVLGFVREALIAFVLGAGPVSDAFYAAFRFPNLFRRLFAEGAFNAAFIPLFAKELEGGGEKAAELFARQVLSVLLFVLIALSALAMIFMPFLVGTVIAPKFAEIPEKFDLTVLLTRIMFPYLAAMSLVAMLSGILNSYRKYFLAAISPVLLNVVLVAVLVLAVRLNADPRTIGISMASGVMLSGLLQLGLLVYGVRRAGFHVRIGTPRLTPPVRRLLWLALPAAITGGITQLNLLIGQIIISGQDGAISMVNYADRIIQLPLGVIGIAIGVVLLPELSRALKEGNAPAVNQLQNSSLEFGLGLTVPAAVAFAIIPAPVVALLFERGEFTRETTMVTAAVLAAFAAGLPAFVLNKIFTPSFYAREDMRSPMWFAGVNAAVNVAGSLILFPIVGVKGVAIATSAAGWVNVILLGGLLYKEGQFMPTRLTLRRVVLVIVASALMGLALYLALLVIGPAVMDGSFLMRLGLMLILIAGGVLVYFAIVLLTGAMDRAQLLSLVSRRRV